jgi:ElaB/YqjD/DUF883 family membrane-anchored ribosome-binding protein
MKVGKIFRSVSQIPFNGRDRSTAAGVRLLLAVEARLANAQESLKVDLVKAQENSEFRQAKLQESLKVDLFKAQESLKVDLVKAQENSEFRQAKLQESLKVDLFKAQESLKVDLVKAQESMKEFIKTRDGFLLLRVLTAVGTGTGVGITIFYWGGGVITPPWKSLQ